ncbi:hypothetical protein [Pseudomonas sp. Irchel s3b2]|nr:hypothetical protein [Pseudomonas sp. Irchel s3b2]
MIARYDFIVVASGIRMGTLALTNRGLGEAQCAEVANPIADR